MFPGDILLEENVFWLKKKIHADTDPKNKNAYFKSKIASFWYAENRKFLWFDQVQEDSGQTDILTCQNQ